MDQVFEKIELTRSINKVRIKMTNGTYCWPLIIIIIIIVIITLFQEDNIFGRVASLTYGPQCMIL